MDLALATGYGPPTVSRATSRAVRHSSAPRTRSSSASATRRNRPATAASRFPMRSSHSISVVVRAAGARAAAAHALVHLTRPDAPYHSRVHVDADVLDDTVMPAVDYRQPGGLSADELATILAAALATGRVAGVDVTIYNPALDPAGTSATATRCRRRPGTCRTPRPRAHDRAALLPGIERLHQAQRLLHGGFGRTGYRCVPADAEGWDPPIYTGVRAVSTPPGDLRPMLATAS